MKTGFGRERSIDHVLVRVVVRSARTVALTKSSSPLQPATGPRSLDHMPRGLS